MGPTNKIVLLEMTTYTGTNLLKKQLHVGTPTHTANRHSERERERERGSHNKKTVPRQQTELGAACHVGIIQCTSGSLSPTSWGGSTANLLQEKVLLLAKWRIE